MSKRYSVTKSQYGSLLKGGVARSCNSCDYEVPKYVGRYSSSCATSDCDGQVGSPVDDAVESVITGSNINDVIVDLIERSSMHSKMKNASNLKKHIGLGASAGALGGGIAGYREAKKNKTSKFKGTLKGIGIGGATGGAIGTVGGLADKYYKNHPTRRQRKLAKLNKLALKLHKDQAETS